MDEWKHKNVKWCTIQAKMISWSCRIPLSTMNRTIVPDVVPLIVWTIRFHRCYILDNIHMCTQGQTTGHFTLCTHIQHSYDFWYSITSLYILHILIISSLFGSSWNQCWLFNWTGIDLSWIIFAFKEMHLKISSGIFCYISEALMCQLFHSRIVTTTAIYELRRQEIFQPRQNSVITWWRHQMETFPMLLVLCEFLSQRPVTRSFDVFFDLCLNK